MEEYAALKQDKKPKKNKEDFYILIWDDHHDMSNKTKSKQKSQSRELW